MPDQVQFDLVSPERLLLSRPVDMVVAPGSEGDFGVLPGHAPFMTALKEGDVTVIDGATRRVFRIQGGFADVTPQGLTILAEHATETA